MMERQSKPYRTRSAAIAQKLAASPRATVRQSLIEGWACNLGHIRRIQGQLLSELSPEKRAAVKHQLLPPARRSLPSRGLRFLKQRILNRALEEEVDARSARVSIGYMLELFQYMRRDWAGLPLGEERTQMVEASVFELLREHAVDRNSAVVLGAGMARFAWDLRSMFDHVFAIEASILAAMFHDMLRRGEITIHEVNEQSAYKISDHSSKTIVSIPQAVQQAEGGSFAYCVADARKIPLADHSISAVVSIYFTDVLPLSALLPEVKRLLKPGGIFLHFGPLDYHFEDFDEKYSVDEVRELFRKEGFEIKTESWIEDIVRSDARMGGRYYNAWCFAAICGI